MSKKSLPLSKVYRLIEPGPVVLVTTSLGGKPNVMTMAWHMMVEFEPPLIACVISNRNRTFDILKKNKECVVNIPTVEIAKKAIACGSFHGGKTDKFKKVGLTPVTGDCVKAPLIDECYANLECIVADARLAEKYNIFILEVVHAWIDPSIKHPRTFHHRGEGTFVVDGKTLRLPFKIK